MLRPWRLSDARAVVDAFNDPEIQRWHVRRADSEDEARQWISEWRDGWTAEAQLNWALVDRTSDSLTGRISLKCVDLHDGSAEAAYWMAPAWRGRGLCSQALTTLCQWAFREVGFQRIGLEHSVARNSQILWIEGRQATSDTGVSGDGSGVMSTGRSRSLPWWNTAPARTNATRCGALTARHRDCAASISL